MKTLKITQGNDFVIYLPLVLLNSSGTEAVNTNNMTDVVVKVKRACASEITVTPSYVQNYMVLAFAQDMAMGAYDADIKFKLSGVDKSVQINKFFEIVEFDHQSNWRDFIVGDHVVPETQAFLAGAHLTDADYIALKAQLTAAIAAAAAAKAEWEAKTAELSDVAQQTTLNQVKTTAQNIKTETDKIGIPTDPTKETIFKAIAGINIDTSALAQRTDVKDGSDTAILVSKAIRTLIGTNATGQPATLFEAIAAAASGGSDEAVKAILTLALHQTYPGYNAIQLSTKVKECSDDIFAAISAAGYDTTTLPLEDVYLIIQSLGKTVGAYILDVNGTKWTASQWQQYVDLHHEYPATPVGALMLSDRHSFIVGLTDMGAMRFGNYNHTVITQDGYGGTGIATPYSGLRNTIAILQTYNPAKLKNTQFAVNATMQTTVLDLDGKYVAFFEDEATLLAWANSIGFAPLASIGARVSYCYPVVGDPTKYVVRQFNTGSASVSFNTKEASTPFTDNYSVMGCPPAELCFDYKAYSGDTRQWHLVSIHEAFMMALNRTALNACITAAGGNALPAGYHWTAQQNVANPEYFVDLSSGAINPNSKGGSYSVRAVSNYVSA